MVRQTYLSLGPSEEAMATFETLAPQVAELVAIERGCPDRSPDSAAAAVAIEALETAAYHFTRRRRFFDDLRIAARQGPGRPLGGREEAKAAFVALAPLMQDLRAIRCAAAPSAGTTWPSRWRSVGWRRPPITSPGTTASTGRGDAACRP